LLGIPGDPIQPRRAAVFRHGNLIDRALKHDISEVLGAKFLNLDQLPVNKCTIEGIEVTFTPDGAFELDNQIGIIEIKSMSDFAFDRARQGLIDKSYLCQAWVYSYGTSFNPVVFICYRKETSHFCEVVFDREAKDVVVTQRFGADPLELAINDPLLVAEIHTPFDQTVESTVRGKFARLQKVKSETDLAPRLIEDDRGKPVIEEEKIAVQGAANAAAWADTNNTDITKATKSGSWYKFPTGRNIAGFPCSFCSYIRICRNAELDFKDRKPIWVIHGEEESQSTDIDVDTVPPKKVNNMSTD